MKTPTAAKEVLILANSRKPNGRCVAGIDLEEGDAICWVRPVSDREHHEVSASERQYKDGREPSILEVVRIPLVRPAPELYQTENWLLNPNFRWEHLETFSVRQLERYADSTDLWLVDTVDTQFGLNDRVPLDQAEDLTTSLSLIYVEDLQYKVFAPSAAFGNPRRRVQASFTHNGTKYRAYVTDPEVEREYCGLPDAYHSVGSAYLTVSLGEPHDGYAYKLVAAVIPI